MWRTLETKDEELFPAEAPDFGSVALPMARRARQVAMRRQLVVWKWGTTAGALWRGDDSRDGRPLGRVARCGRHALAQGVVAIRCGRWGHYASGLIRCGSIWVCPVCSPAIRWRREQLLSTALERLRAKHGTVERLVTLTVPHGARDELATLLTGLAQAWHRLVSGRNWAEGSPAHGIVGWLRAVDITVSAAAGWHPHLHVLLVLDADRRTADEELAGWLTERWISSCRGAGLRVPSRLHGVDVRDVGRSSPGYLLRIVTETVRSDIKVGRGIGSYGPLQLLDLAGTPSEAWAAECFRTYEKAVHGRHAMASSQSLRPWILSAQPGECAAGADEQATRTEDTDPVVAQIAANAWRVLYRSPVGVSNLLALLDAGRPLQALTFLDEIRHREVEL